jgi:hypothetical protein
MGRRTACVIPPCLTLGTDNISMETTGIDPPGVRATSRPTRFSLAANYDPDLVPKHGG